MAEIIRAVYEQGRLRPLDPLPLTDGQEICLAVLSKREQAAEVDEAALVATIDAALQGHPPISDAILDERREGP